MRVTNLSVLLLAGSFLSVLAFSPQDYEIFRIRDEVAAAEGKDYSFYDLLGVKVGASQDEISKAVRKRSKALHPDRVRQQVIADQAKKANKPKIPGTKKPKVHVNKAPKESEIQRAIKKANEKYGRLRTIREILQGSGRERYDFFLANGFPSWRGTGYYYARYRPGLGTVLVGLFLFGGGLVHYGAMYLGWKRQREFVGRYIRQARRSAWGDESGIQGVPGINTAGSGAATPASVVSGNEDFARENGQALLNRRQKRAQEKESRKEKKAGKGAPATPDEAEDPTIPSAPFGVKKRVQAENGKILIVDSIGNVFLEEENEAGEKIEMLLDPDDIVCPTFRDTIVIRLPVWLFTTIKGKLTGGAKAGGTVLGTNEKDTDSDSSSESKPKEKARTRVKRKDHKR